MINIFRRKKNKSSDGGKDEGTFSKSKQSDHEKESSAEEKINHDLEKDITIHTMPKRFRTVHEVGKKAKTAGLFIIIGGAIILVVISVFLYIYLIKNKPVKKVVVPDEASVAENANQEVLPEASDEDVDTEIPAEEEIATTTEEIVEETTMFLAGEDSDGDGLSNKEENLFGSDIGKIDSDGDGYDDKSEVVGLYDPMGAKKLENGSRVVKYNNSEYRYNLIYPINWIINSIGGKDSIIFKSVDNHFIQVITQANTKKENITDWYKDQFNVDIIDSSKIVKSGSWEGIRSVDNFTIYITDIENKNIYIITYNIGNNDTIEYSNVLEMIIKSFEII